jgi:predicted GIY-YIG superfamily endonuclease
MNQNSKKCGIYMVKCKINSKIYIGQSIDMERRWDQHKYGKGNIILRNAIQKYGLDNFEFSILEEVIMENKPKEVITEELYKKEQLWFDKLKPYENGYNINKVAKPNETNFTRDEDFGKKISRIKIENNHTGKPIIQYSLDGEFIKEWPSSTSVQRELGFNARNIGGCANKETFTSNGYIWRFKDDPLVESDLNKVKNKRPKTKKVYQYDLKGNLVGEYMSVKEASETSGYDYACITSVCSGRLETYRDHFWSYAPKTDFTLKKRLKKSITQNSLDGEFIKEWPSSNKILTNLRIDSKIIRKLCKNGGGVYRGYFWYFS